MATLSMTVASIFIPLGFALAAIALTYKNLHLTVGSIVIIVIGLFALFCSVHFVYKEKREQWLREQLLDEAAVRRHQGLIQILKSIRETSKNE